MKKVLIIMIVLVSVLSCTKKSDENQKSKIAWFTGNVQILRDSNTIVPILGMEILQNDVVKTGDKSAISVQIGSNLVVSIRQNSEVSIDSIVNPGKKELYIKKGTVVSKASKLLKEDSVKVNTPVAVAAIRGTVFSVQYDESGENIITIAVSEGKVEVAELPKDAQPVVVDGNNTLEITKDQPEKVEVREIKTSENILNGVVKPVPYMSEKSESNSNADETSATINSKDNEVVQKVEEAKKKEKIEAEKSKKPAMPKTLEEIKARYGRVDQILLYSGKKINGVILKRGTTFTVLTVNGYVKVKAADVKSTKVIM